MIINGLNTSFFIPVPDGAQVAQAEKVVSLAEAALPIAEAVALPATFILGSLWLPALVAKYNPEAVAAVEHDAQNPMWVVQHSIGRAPALQSVQNLQLADTEKTNADRHQVELEKAWPQYEILEFLHDLTEDPLQRRFFTQHLALQATQSAEAAGLDQGDLSVRMGASNSPTVYRLVTDQDDLSVESFPLSDAKYGIYDPSEPATPYRLIVDNNGKFRADGQGFGFVILRGAGVIAEEGLCYCSRLTMHDPRTGISVDSHLPVDYEDLDIFEHDFKRLVEKLLTLGMYPHARVVINIIYGTDIDHDEDRNNHQYAGELIAEIVEDAGFSVHNMIPAESVEDVFYFNTADGTVRKK